MWGAMLGAPNQVFELFLYKAVLSLIPQTLYDTQLNYILHIFCLFKSVAGKKKI